MSDDVLLSYFLLISINVKNCEDIWFNHAMSAESISMNLVIGIVTDLEKHIGYFLWVVTIQANPRAEASNMNTTLFI